MNGAEHERPEMPITKGCKRLIEEARGKIRSIPVGERPHKGTHPPPHEPHPLRPQSALA